MPDRIADPWGLRTPYASDAGRGPAEQEPGGSPWPVRVDAFLEHGRARGGRRAVGAERLDPALERRRDRHRGQGRADRRRARPRGRPRQPRPARTRRTCSAGRPTNAADRLRRPLVRERRSARRDGLGHGDGAHRRALARAARRPRRLGPVRLLHERPAVPRGVLHARGDREGRHRHAAHGRQHAALHGDRRGRAQGQLRHRRPARLVHRRRPLRRDRAVGPQRRRDADGALDAHARPPPRRRPAADAGRRPAPDRRWRARPTSTSPSATARTWR